MDLREVSRKVKINSGLLKGKVGYVRNTFDWHGVKMYIVVVHITEGLRDISWDNHFTTLRLDQFEYIV